MLKSAKAEEQSCYKNIMNCYRYTIKALFLLFSAVCIASCNEKIDASDNVAAERITVMSEVAETKAGYEGTTVLPSKFIMNIDQNNSSYNYSLVTMAKVEGNTYREQGNTTLYWASNDHSNVKIKALTLPYGLDKTDFTSVMPINVCEDQRTEENVKKSDLLGAKTGDGVVIEENEIKINFRHLMSKFFVSYSIKNNLYDSKMQVNSITIENTCIKGGYSYANMNYDNSISKEFGNIQMYHNSSNRTAEAIFYPYVQTENATLVVNVTINGADKDLKCPVALNDPKGYIGGNRYKIAVEIDGNSIKSTSVTKVNDWIEDNTTINNLTDKKILWIGTSIPKGSGDNNYPRMVAEALGCQIVNNAQGASRASLTRSPRWSTAEDFGKYYSEGYSLSATEEEIEEIYGSILLENKETLGLSEGGAYWWISEFKMRSFENVLIPYINGEKDSCDIVIIDHGFNDSQNIIMEGAEHPSVDETKPLGLAWYQSIASGNEVYSDVNGLGKRSYLAAMSFLIEECRRVNPNIKIIIGNHFASRPYSYTWDFPEYGGALCGDLTVKANQAVAAMWDLDIVDVYKYTGLDNAEGDFTKFKAFCPDDYVHPHKDATGGSNQTIAYIYVKELKRIFGGN